MTEQTNVAPQAERPDAAAVAAEPGQEAGQETAQEARTPLETGTPVAAPDAGAMAADTTSVESHDDAERDVETPTPASSSAQAQSSGASSSAAEDWEAEDDGNDGERDRDGDVDPGRTRPRRATDLEREGEVAADFLETLLDIADLDGDIDVDVDGDRAAVAIVDSEEGRVPRRLVGPDGKVLDALQELTRLAVQSATGERSRLMLDVAGYRAERRSALVDIAKNAIEDVKRSGERKALEPMSAFERKVVHDEVLAAGLKSESDGVEPRRFVVVLPA